MDVCGLLEKMVQMHADIGAMRTALQLQVDVCADLCAITMDVNCLVCSLECATDVARDGGRDVCGSALEVTCDSGSTLVVEDVTMLVTEAIRAAACEEGGEARFLALSNSGETNGGRVTHSPASPKWSRLLLSKEESDSQKLPTREDALLHLVSGNRVKT